MSTQQPQAFDRLLTRMLLQTTLAAEKMGKVWEDETDKILQEMKDHVEIQDVQIKKLEDSVDELNGEVGDLKSQMGDLEFTLSESRDFQEEFEETEKELADAQELLEGLEPDSLTEEMKLTIAKNLLKNLSLEQMENLEKHAKESFSHTNKPYVEIPQ